MSIDFNNSTLFSFLLDCYEELEGDDLANILPTNHLWDYASFAHGKKSFTFPQFVKFLENRGYKKYFANKRFLTDLLRYLDTAIYSFTEFDDLFHDQGIEGLQNDKYYLIIASQNSVYKQINRTHGWGVRKSDDEEWLRNRRQFNPSKTCYKIGLKNLNFVNKTNQFIINQKFSILPQLANDLTNNILNVGLFPFMKLNGNGAPLMTIKKDSSSFEIFYKNNFQNKYLDYLTDAFRSEAKIIVFPENSIPFSNKCYIGNTLKYDNQDVDKLIIAGTNWDNKTNICFVFDDRGQLLAEQKKFNPFVLKENNDRFFENLNNSAPFVVNIVHVKNFGTIGFPICSDLISSKYIESIYCDCDVSNLIIPCMSISDDIYSSLRYLSSHYWICSIVCNANIGKKKVIGFYSVPTKEKKTCRSAKSKFFKAKKSKNDTCKGVVRKINLS